MRLANALATDCSGPSRTLPRSFRLLLRQRRVGRRNFQTQLDGRTGRTIPAARCGAPRSRSHSAAEVDHLGHPGAVVVAWQRGRPCSSDWPRSERRQRPSPHPRPRLRLATDGNESPRAGRRRRRRLLAENKGCLAPASNESPRAGHPRLVSAGRAIWARRPRVAHHLQCLALRAASASSCHLFLHGAK